MKFLCVSILLGFVLFTSMSHHCHASENAINTTNALTTTKSFSDKIKDPARGKLDISELMSSAHGFLPLPIIITEPAVGFGGGISLIFLHDSINSRLELIRKNNQNGKKIKIPPPSISGLAGFGTENGTWGAGAFHLGIWKNDAIRYLGVFGHASVNYDFFGIQGKATPINVDGTAMLQQMIFRLGESDFFAGANYKIVSSTAKSNFEIPLPPPVGEGIEVQSGGASLILEYDSRDNIFTPNYGLSSKMEWTHFDSWLGSDTEFDQIAIKNRFWHTLTDSLVLGLRGDGFLTSGEVPFYMLPFVQLRGIPAMRYQGEHILTTEAELRWDFTQRWSLVGFAGAGWSALNDFSDIKNSDTYPAGGFGIRYLIASLYNLRTGIDIGLSEEDTAIYLTTGTAWGN